MTSRVAFPAFAFVVVLTACDAGITDPSYRRLDDLSLASTFACGIDSDAFALCWGEDNASGQLGSGDNSPRELPRRIVSGARFVQVVTGARHACGLTTDGRALCWGDNAFDQLGSIDRDLTCELEQSNGWVQDFGNACSTVPVAIQSSLRFTQLAVGSDRTCGLTNGGALWCWGTGTLGDSALTFESATPVRVAIPGSIQAFTLGRDHACASDADGLGWCWGSNSKGALGLGVASSPTAYSAVPLRINSSAYLKALAAGYEHTCAVTGSGAVLCWGAGSAGQRGDSSTTATSHDPVFVKTAVNFSGIAAAGSSTCGLQTGTGAAWCWGENGDGELGDGTTQDRITPGAVLGGIAFKRLTMAPQGYPNPSMTCGVTGGGAYCWGVLPEPLTFEE